MKRKSVSVVSISHEQYEKGIKKSNYPKIWIRMKLWMRQKRRTKHRENMLALILATWTVVRRMFFKERRNHNQLNISKTTNNAIYNVFNFFQKWCHNTSHSSQVKRSDKAEVIAAEL